MNSCQWKNLTDFYAMYTQQRSDAGNTPNQLPTGYKREPKFKKGDTVRSLTGNSEYEILESVGLNSSGQPEYFVKDVLSKEECYYVEDFLTGEWAADSLAEKNRCHCGAKHDRHFPNNHSSWCPEYRSNK